MSWELFPIPIKKMFPATQNVFKCSFGDFKKLFFQQNFTYVEINSNSNSEYINVVAEYV